MYFIHNLAALAEH